MEHDDVVLAQRVSFYYHPRRPILGDLSIHLTTGSVLQVTGPNGSGKTTLLQVLAGRLRPRQGTVEVLRPCAYVPSELAFHEALTVREEASYVGAVGSISTDDLMVRIHAWGFDDDLLDTEIRDLSTGWRARFALAVADASQPKVLLLDEPFANLDVAGRDLVDQLIARVATRGAVVLVDHGNDAAVCVGHTLTHIHLDAPAASS